MRTVLRRFNETDFNDISTELNLEFPGGWLIRQFEPIVKNNKFEEVVVLVEVVNEINTSTPQPPT